MTANGLMAFDEVTTEGGRMSKRYYLSDSGEARYSEWLRWFPLDYTLSLNSQREFLLKLTFIGSLPRSEQANYVQDALDYFRYEKDELMSGHIDLESAYLSPDLPEHDAVMNLWQHEIAFIYEREAALCCLAREVIIFESNGWGLADRTPTKPQPNNLYSCQSALCRLEFCHMPV